MRTRAAKEEPGRTESGKGVFDQLIALNRTAFQRSRFSAAYHILAAAQAWANADDDERQLALVEKLAKEEREWIDAYAPKYEHSTQSASLRGHASTYTNLEHQAHTAQVRIGSRRKFDQMIRSLPSSELGQED